jgi:hypothetical protein
MLILANKQDLPKAQSLSRLFSSSNVSHLTKIYENYAINPYNGDSPRWIVESAIRLQESSSITQPESKRKEPHVKLGKVSPEGTLAEYSRSLLTEGMVWLVDKIKSQSGELEVILFNLFQARIEKDTEEQAKSYALEREKVKLRVQAHKSKSLCKEDWKLSSSDIWGGISKTEEQSPDTARPSPTTTSAVMAGFNVDRDSVLLPITPTMKSSSMEKIYEMTGTNGGERELFHRENPNPKAESSSSIIGAKPPRPLMEQRDKGSGGSLAPTRSSHFGPTSRPSTKLLPITR